ncbi:MAG: energy-coupling factor ABC transporter ATP-binding protein [Marinifilaceae bacterium]
MDKLPILQLENISFHYPDGTQAIHQLSCTIKKGEKVVLLGENGCGKSTLFQLLNGLRKPQKGSYHFNGEEIRYNRKDCKKLLHNIGIVFQDPDVQIFAADVMQEISFGPKNMGYPNEKVRQLVLQAMEQTNILSLKEKPTHFLSYGQKKRVAIADILAMDTEIIIMDEPLAWLDMRHKKKMLNILNQLNQEGKTLIVSTHDPNFAYEWADTIHIMHQGAILEHGTPEHVFSNKEILSKAGLELPLIFELAQNLDLNLMPRSKKELLSILQPDNLK